MASQQFFASHSVHTLSSHRKYNYLFFSHDRVGQDMTGQDTISSHDKINQSIMTSRFAGRVWGHLGHRLGHKMTWSRTWPRRHISLGQAVQAQANLIEVSLPCWYVGRLIIRLSDCHYSLSVWAEKNVDLNEFWANPSSFSGPATSKCLITTLSTLISHIIQPTDA